MTDPLQLLPGWTGWVSLAVQAAVALLAGVLAATLAAAVGGAPLRRAAAAHWSERARLAHPARLASLLGLLVAPVAGAVFGRAYAGPLSAASPAVHGLVGGASAFLGALAVHVRLNRRVGRPGATVAAWLRDVAAAICGLYLHLAGALVFGLLAPPGIGRRTLWFLVAAIVLAGFAFRGGGLVLARALRLARPAGERLRRAVGAAAARTGIRPRDVDELAWGTANAFALPGCGRLVFTRGALAALDDDGIAAVAAHELAHLGESDRVRGIRFAATLAVVAALTLAPPLGAAHGWPAGLATLVAALVVLRLFRGVARRLESDADAAGRAGEGADGAYGRALAAIYRANVLPAVAGRRPGTHPHLYDRLVAVGVQPDFPRPAPPSRGRALAAALLAAVLAIAPVAGARVGVRLLPVGPGDRTDAVSAWAIGAAAADGGDPHDVGLLAHAAEVAGDAERALALYAAAFAADERLLWAAANRVTLLVDLGRCDEAEQAALALLARASQRIGPSDPEWNLDVVRMMDAAAGCRDGAEGAPDL